MKLCYLSTMSTIFEMQTTSVTIYFWSITISAVANLVFNRRTSFDDHLPTEANITLEHSPEEHIDVFWRLFQMPLETTRYMERKTFYLTFVGNWGPFQSCLKVR